MDKPKIEWKGESLHVVAGSYGNDRIAMTVVDDKNRPFAVATVNLPYEPIAKDEVFIKNWSENNGILDALIDANIVKREGIRLVPTGFTHAHRCKLSEEYKQYLKSKK